jgi:hypothetical protein
MKINIVVDKKGTVVGILREEFEGKGGAKIQAGIVVKPGHAIHRIEVDDKIMREPPAKIHKAVQKIATKHLGPKGVKLEL